MYSVLVFPFCFGALILLLGVTEMDYLCLPKVTAVVVLAEEVAACFALLS